MSIHCVVRSRIDPHIKAEAVQVFDNMGLTLSEAIRLFLYQSVAEKRIPFSINIPNATTRAASNSRTNWEELRRGDDRDINYTDIPKMTKDFWKDAELLIPSDKVHISLRLDEDVVKFFKIQGRGYQTRINSILKSYVRSHSS